MKGQRAGGQSFSRGALYALLKNPIYIGKIAHQGNHYEGQHAAILDHALWERAQTVLDTNRQEQHTRTAVKDPSLLSGMLYDDSGHPMSPTHTRKGNQRYRYYVSQAVLRYKDVLLTR